MGPGCVPPGDTGGTPSQEIFQVRSVDLAFPQPPITGSLHRTTYRSIHRPADQATRPGGRYRVRTTGTRAGARGRDEQDDGCGGPRCSRAPRLAGAADVAPRLLRADAVGRGGDRAAHGSALRGRRLGPDPPRVVRAGRHLRPLPGPAGPDRGGGSPRCRPVLRPLRVRPRTRLPRPVGRSAPSAAAHGVPRRPHRPDLAPLRRRDRGVRPLVPRAGPWWPRRRRLLAGATARPRAVGLDLAADHDAALAGPGPVGSPSPCPCGR